LTVSLFLLAFAAIFALSYAESAFDEDGELYGLLDEVKVAEKYVHMIEHFGAKAWNFLKCMGLKWALDCSQPTLACLVAKNIPGCVDLVVCEGKDAKACSHNLN